MDITEQLFPKEGGPGRPFATSILPEPQARARRTVLDMTEFFGDSSGGVRTYLSEKARFVERSESIRQTIVVPGARDRVTESERVRCYAIGGPRVPGQPPYRFLLDAASSGRILANERPDIVEVGSPGLAPWHVASVSLRLGIPLVSYFHSHVPRLLQGSARRPSVVRRAGAALAWRYLRHVDQIFARTIVSSRYAAAELAAGGIERTTYVPLGVDVEHFHPRRKNSRGLVRRLLYADDRPLVLYAGRFAPEKNLGALLRVWPQVARRTGAVLVLAGDGPLRSRFLARNPHPDIRWLGFVDRRDRLANLLAAADVVVSPGSMETFGLAALEALASGTAVLSANVGGAAELVASSGGGALFDPGDDLDFATSLERLLTGACAALGATGREYAARRHRWDDVFSSLFAVYDDILGAAA